MSKQLYEIAISSFSTRVIAWQCIVSLGDFYFNKNISTKEGALFEQIKNRLLSDTFKYPSIYVKNKNFLPCYTYEGINFDQIGATINTLALNLSSWEHAYLKINFPYQLFLDSNFLLSTYKIRMYCDKDTPFDIEDFLRKEVICGIQNILNAHIKYEIPIRNISELLPALCGNSELQDKIILNINNIKVACNE